MNVKLLLLTKRMLVRSGSKSSLAVVTLAAGTGTLTAALLVYETLLSDMFFKILVPIMFLLGISTFAYGALFIFFVVYNLFQERRSIIGVLKTIGYPNKFVFHLFSLQGLILGFAGSLIGVTFGANLVGALLFSWFYQYFLLPFHERVPYTPWSWMIFLLGVFLPYFLSENVAKKAASMDVTLAFTKVPNVANPYVHKSFSNNFELYARRRVIRRPIVHRLLMVTTLLTLISTSAMVYLFYSFPSPTESYLRIVNYVYQRVSIISYLIILLTGLLGFYAIWNSEQLRRKIEFSVMKTIGWSNKDLMKITIYEMKYVVVTPFIISISLLVLFLLFAGSIPLNMLRIYITLLNLLAISFLFVMVALLTVYKIVRKPVIENLKILELELLQEFR